MRSKSYFAILTGLTMMMSFKFTAFASENVEEGFIVEDVVEMEDDVLGAYFVVRNAPPNNNNSYYYGDNGYTGYSMPNCTAYAYGRLYEITGSKPKVSMNNANKWFDYNKSGNYYTYSQDAYAPQLGAIVCYTTSGVGHVQVVEEIGKDENGKYLVASESNFGGRESGKEWKKFNYVKIYLDDLEGYYNKETHYIRIKYLEDNDGYTEPRNNDGNYAIDATFQGYIYACPEMGNATIGNIQEVSIDQYSFPDSSFRERIKSFDKDGNGILSVEEIKKVKELEIRGDDGGYNYDIKSITGIEYLTELEEFHFFAVIDKLDLRKNKKLIDVNIGYKTAKEVNVSGLNQLVSFEIGHPGEIPEYSESVFSGNMSVFNASGCSLLESISLGNNKLTSLDISGCSSLESVNLNNNKLTSLDFSECNKLNHLSCDNNELHTLDISDCVNLETLYCYGNKLKKLNIGSCTKLKTLWCGENPIEEIDVSKCGELEELNVWMSKLKKIDVTKNVLLKSISFYDTNIEFVDLSNSPKLSWIAASKSKLWCLDLSKTSADASGSAIMCTVITNTKRIDLSQKKGFDVSRIDYCYYPLEGGYIDGNILVMDEDKDSLTYTYLCGNNTYLHVTVTYIGNGSNQNSGGTLLIGFSDVSSNKWYYESIKYVTENSIMKGVGDGTRFDPDAPLTREMFATVLYRMAGEPAVTYKGKFPDVPGGKWYSNAVVWASGQGIVSGYSNGKFGTGDYITREQIAKMFMEYGKMQGYDVSQRADFSTFADAGKVSGWANDYMKWAVGSGMIGGSLKDGKYYLNPKGNATRAESATMLKRFLEKY